MSVCDVPWCDRPGLLGYFGRWLCAVCWKRLADAEAGQSDDEAHVLLHLGLERTSAGEVVELARGACKPISPSVRVAAVKTAVRPPFELTCEVEEV